MQGLALALSSASIDMIDRIYSSQRSRTCVIETPDGMVAVKGQRRPRDFVRFKLLSWIALALRNPLMRPVPIHGGSHSQRIEIARLSRLLDFGIAVPRVLYETDQYFVMQGFQGFPLDSKLALSSEISTPLFTRGLYSIAEVHQKGQCLSQAFARNIFINDQGGLWFLDHEDEPLEALTLAEAQARDYLLYLLSVLWLNRGAWGEWMRIWSRLTECLDKELVGLLIESTRSLLWMRRLPAKRRPFGRDILQAQALAAFVFDWIHSDGLSRQETRRP